MCFCLQCGVLIFILMLGRLLFCPNKDQGPVLLFVRRRRTRYLISNGSTKTLEFIVQTMVSCLPVAILLFFLCHYYVHPLHSRKSFISTIASVLKIVGNSSGPAKIRPNWRIRTKFQVHYCSFLSVSKKGDYLTYEILRNSPKTMASAAKNNWKVGRMGN